jgi:hypothetical protein
MIKRFLLSIALVGAMAACTSPAATSTPGLSSPSAPELSPEESAPELTSPSEQPSMEAPSESPAAS